MYPDFEYRGYCRKFKTGLILLEKETMNLFDIDIYSYHMSDREEFVASALLSNLKHLDPEDARKQIESVIRRREDGDFEIEGKALTSLIDQTVQSDYKELIDRTSEEYSAFILIKAAGHYKQTQIATMIEAVINVLISIILVYKYGIIGVAIGTLSATVFYNVYEMYYLSNHIVNRKVKYFIKQLIADLLFIFLFYMSSNRIIVSSYNYLAWLKTALIYAGTGIIIEICIQLLFYKENVETIYKELRNRI